MLSVSVPSVVPPGSGLRKLNASVLEEEEYFQLIRDFLSTWRRRKHLFPSLANWWEVDKKRVKRLTNSYRSRRSRSVSQERDLLVRLAKHI